MTREVGPKKIKYGDSIPGLFDARGREVDPIFAKQAYTWLRENSKKKISLNSILTVVELHPHFLTILSVNSRQS